MKQEKLRMKTFKRFKESMFLLFFVTGLSLTRWATDEWATSRRQLMDSLGHRSNIFAQSEKHQHHPSQTPFKVPETPQTVGKDLSSIYLQTPRVLRSPVSEFSQTPSIVPTPTADKNTKSSRPPLEQSELMRKHAEVVRLLRTSAESSSQRSSASLTVQNQQNFAPATTLATQLEGASHSPSLLSDAKAAGMKESDIPAYRNLLQLLASMTGRQRYLPHHLIPIRRI